MGGEESGGRGRDGDVTGGLVLVEGKNCGRIDRKVRGQTEKKNPQKKTQLSHDLFFRPAGAMTEHSITSIISKNNIKSTAL